MAGEFVVTRNGRETFHDEESLKRLAEGGLLAPGDLVYHPLLGRWLYAREVEEVRAEMNAQVALGRPVPMAPTVTQSAHPLAVTGFVFALLGLVPVVGALACLAGIYFSGRGLVARDGRSQGLAVAGLVLSVVFLLPALACGALLVGLR
jgi:hypothetical protein